MDKIKIGITITVMLFCMHINAQHIIATKLREVDPETIVSTINVWRETKEVEWRKSFAALTDVHKEQIIQRAEGAISFEWPSLLATKYLEFKTSGNRTHYESDVNRRRQMLTYLVMGEIIEDKGRFLPQIVNGLWATLEESTWVSPAHIGVQEGGVGLPNPEDSYIDLGAGRTAAEIAAIYLLLKDRLEEVSPQITKKIKLELENRILKPYVERKDFWWMSLESDFINNWNIWINTNVLKTALLIESDRKRLKEILNKTAKSADRFIDSYPEDGICDEGPSYWTHAGGELGLMMAWWEDISNGKMKFDNISKISNIGNYILNAHIAENKFINFADAHAYQIPNPTKVWIYGKVIGDPNLRSFASYLNGLNKRKTPIGSIHELTTYMEVADEINNYDPNFEKKPVHYYPSLQMATIQSNQAEGNLFMACIGGHNGVSHNHNDVGSFVLYVDSTPIFIDVGVGTYTKDTFNANRYKLWNMQSQWHNLPIINGVQQKEGTKHAAKNVVFKTDKHHYEYSLDLAGAYPKTAEVRYWNRILNFYPAKNEVVVQENFELTSYKKASEIILITPHHPVVKGRQIQLEINEQHNALFYIEKGDAQIAVEEKHIDDQRIANIWGNTIYRIKLTLKGKQKKGKVKYTIKIIPSPRTKINKNQAITI